MTRGAVMRTLGVLADHYSFLNQFKDFLEGYVLYACSIRSSFFSHCRKLNLANLTEKQESDLSKFYFENGPNSTLASTPVPTSSIFFNLPSGGSVSDSVLSDSLLSYDAVFVESWAVDLSSVACNAAGKTNSILWTTSAATIKLSGLCFFAVVQKCSETEKLGKVEHFESFVLCEYFQRH
jgi:hypothetical protein